MSKLAEKVRVLAKAVELLEISPTGTLSRLDISTGVPSRDEQLDLELGTKLGTVRTSATEFAVIAAFTLRVKTKEGAKPVARFVYRCLAKYRGGATDDDDDVLLEFAKSNGMIHLWPYARAFVQAASAQLGLVPILLPVFRVVSAPPDPGKNTAVAELQ